ncbi:hypothetical protein B7494_g6335 [Chlorociboria aeruginascens]|nr:hypothetical protein B7494_g6335 [Chlorociboria aeruginascens]
MSRRGRGGMRGGLKGATWDYDASIKLDHKPSALFPAHPNLKRPAPFTDEEKAQVENYKKLREEIHSGDFYTQSTKIDFNAPVKTYGEDQINSQYGVNPMSVIDPFEGVETYSMKYNPKKRNIPKLSGRTFNKELFPEELWSTLEGKSGEKVLKDIQKAAKKKEALFANTDTKEAQEKILSDKIDKIKEAAVAGEDGEDEDEEDEENIDAEEDYDFEDDEEEMGGDYDGEKYFSPGDDEEEDDGGGGGDDY